MIGEQRADNVMSDDLLCIMFHENGRYPLLILGPCPDVHLCILSSVSLFVACSVILDMS